MKINRIVAICICGTLSFAASLTNANGQEDLKLKERTYSGLLKVDPINFALSEFSVSYEAAVSRKNSFVLGAGLTLSSKSRVYGGENVYGLRGQAQYRIYLTGPNILRGFYVGPYLFYRNIALDRYKAVVDPNWGILVDEKFRGTAYTAGGGFLVGFQTIASDVISFDFYIGSGIKYSKDNVGSSYYNGNYGNTFSDGVMGFRTTGISPYAGFSVGIAI